MSNKVYTMNGVAFYPTDITIDEDRKGVVKEMADGSTRFFHKAFKKKWTMTWSNARESVLTQVKTLRALTTSFTLIDAFGVSHTVILLPASVQYVHSAGSIALNGIEYYNITLTVQES